MIADKLQNEPEEYYELFQTYLMMGFGRSVTELAQTYGVSRQHIYNLMKKYDWKERIKKNDKKILSQIKEQHNQTFQKDALLRRENVINGYSLLQRTYAKMLDYSDRYTSSTMEADEFLNKTDKLFSIIQKYERISQNCEKYLNKFGIETVGQTEELSDDREETNQEIEEFTENNSKEDIEIETVQNEENDNEELISLENFFPEINEDFELTEEELADIDKDVNYGYPSSGDKKERESFRKSLIFEKMKQKYREQAGLVAA